MIPYIPQILAGIAGVIMYYVLFEYIETYIKINIKNNIFIPIFIILLMFSGIMIAQTVHYSETIARNNSAERNLSLSWCLFEDNVTCSNNINVINNENYNTAVSSGQYPAQMFIGVSLPDLLYKNAFSYFCIGLLLSWVIICLGGKLYERKL